MRSARPIAPALLAAALLTACASPGAKPAPTAALTPTQQFHPEVVEGQERLGFTVHPEGPSLKQRAALAAFAAHWRETPGAGDIALQAPAGADAATLHARDQLGDALVNLGVPAQRLHRTDYTPADAARPVYLAYAALQARGPDCSAHWDDLAATGANRVTTHFGCAETANLAAQIADPRDLLGPAASAPADAERRDVVLGKYRQGAVTSSARDEQATGAVSKVVQ